RAARLALEGPHAIPARRRAPRNRSTRGTASSEDLERACAALAFLASLRYQLRGAVAARGDRRRPLLAVARNRGYSARRVRSRVGAHDGGLAARSEPASPGSHRAPAGPGTAAPHDA